MDKRSQVSLGLVLLAAAGLAVSCGPRQPAGGGPAAGQVKHDQALYTEESSEGKTRTVLAADLTGFEKPTDPAEFTKFFHLPPVRQDNTGTCWSFAATSLLESELRRRGKADVKLSEMFTVYWEYVEKARRFVREKGNSFLGQGSEPNSAMERIRQYGLVRASDFTGLLDGKTSHDHGPLFSEFRVPDNWWHSRDFHNLPLYEFSLALLRALRRGYTATLAVDFSEPGYSGENDVAMVPSFDIPRSYIDQSSREYRFTNGSSTDNHAVHCVGYLESAKGNWFLIKDSWENAYRGKAKGYFFCQDDYVRLKCLMFLVHKDAVKEVLDKFAAAR